MKKIDLGCSQFKPKGYIGIDNATVNPINNQPFEPDILHDLNRGIPFKDSEVDVVRASHFLEHCDNIYFMMDEIHRVCKRGAKVKIIVPMFETVILVNDKSPNKLKVKLFKTEMAQPFSEKDAGYVPMEDGCNAIGIDNNCLEIYTYTTGHKTAFFPTWFEQNTARDEFIIKDKKFYLQHSGNRGKGFTVVFFCMEIELEVWK